LILLRVPLKQRFPNSKLACKPSVSKTDIT
jgi:hypothetical protein